jgi:hypothetical protein
VRNQQGVVTRRRRLDRVLEDCGHRRRRRRHRLDCCRLDDGLCGRGLFSSRYRHFSNGLHDGRRLGRHRLDHGSRHFSDRLDDGLGSSRLFSDRHWLGLWRYRLSSRLSDGRRLNSSHNRLGLSSDWRRLDRCRLFSDRLDDRLDRCRHFSDRLHDGLDDGLRLDNCLSDGRRLFCDRLFDCYRLHGSRLFSHNGLRLDGSRLFDCGNRLRRDINSIARDSISSLGGHDNFSRRLGSRGLGSSRLFSSDRLSSRGLGSRGLGSRLSSRGLGSRGLGSRGFGGRIDRSCFVSHVASFG